MQTAALLPGWAVCWPASTWYWRRPTPPQAVHDRAGDLRRGYYLEYQSLLRQAEQKGLASDYTSAPMREAQRKACGLRRPAFIEKGETHA